MSWQKGALHFYDILVFDDDRFDIVNNSDMTAQDTAEIILNLLYRMPEFESNEKHEKET